MSATASSLSSASCSSPPCTVNVDYSGVQSGEFVQCLMSISEQMSDGTVKDADNCNVRVLTQKAARETFEFPSRVKTYAITLLFEERGGCLGLESETICRDCYVLNPQGENLTITLKGDSEGISVSRREVLSERVSRR